MIKQCGAAHFQTINEIFCLLDGRCIKAGNGSGVKLLVETDDTKIHTSRKRASITTASVAPTISAIITSIVWIIRVIRFCASSGTKYRYR